MASLVLLAYLAPWAPSGSPRSTIATCTQHWFTFTFSRKGTSTTGLSDGNDDLELRTLDIGVLCRDVPLANVEDRRGLLERLPGLSTRRVAAVVIFVEDPDGGDVVGETGDHVEPEVVVVDSQSDEEGLTCTTLIVRSYFATEGYSKTHPGND